MRRTSGPSSCNGTPVNGIVSAVWMRQYLQMDWQAAMPFGGLLGIELVGEPTPEEVRARLEWREDLCTAGGLLHGGALMGLADSTGGL